MGRRCPLGDRFHRREPRALVPSRRGCDRSESVRATVARAVEDPSPAVRYRVARAVHGTVSTSLAPLVDQALEIDPGTQSTLVWLAEV